MLSQSDVQTIQTVFGIKADELSGALSSTEEVSLGLKLPGKIYKPDEIESLKTTNQDAGIEIGYKKVAKAAGIDLDAGEKDPSIIADKLKTGIEKTLEEKYKSANPSEELTKALEAKVAAENKYNVLLGTHDKLKGDYENATKEYQTLQQQISAKERENEILSYFPKEMNMDRADGLLIVKNLLVTEEVDGAKHHKINGELVTDPLGNPASLKDAVSKLVEDKGWVKGKGKGGDDEVGHGPSLPSDLSDDKAMEYLEKKGINPMSTEGSKMMIELTKDFKG